MFGTKSAIYSQGRVLAIDPGNEQSAWLKFNCDSKKIVDFGYDDNASLRSKMGSTYWNQDIDHLAIEMIASYGMAVGKTVFDTCVWIGRFIEVANRPFTQVYRKDVKMHLCNSMRAKDAHIRQALIDKFGPQGKKSDPGPTFGISGDVWAALGVALTYAETVYKR